MKAVALKMKSYSKSVSIVNNGNIYARLFQMLLVLTGGLALLYVALLGIMVYNIVERKSYETEARAISAEVHDLELEYLSKTANIDMELSRSLGFTETKVEYATRKAIGRSPNYLPMGAAPLSQNEI